VHVSIKFGSKSKKFGHKDEFVKQDCIVIFVMLGSEPFKDSTLGSLCPSVFPTQTLYYLSSFSLHATYPTHLAVLVFTYC